MEFDLSLIVNSLPLLLKGAGLTLEITALAVGLGLIIGLFLGLAQLSKNPIFRWPAKVYVDVIRGTPLLIQIFIIYFACRTSSVSASTPTLPPSRPARSTRAPTSPKSSVRASSPSRSARCAPASRSA